MKLKGITKKIKGKPEYRITYRPGQEAGTQRELYTKNSSVALRQVHRNRRYQCNRIAKDQSIRKDVEVWCFKLSIEISPPVQLLCDRR